MQSSMLRRSAVGNIRQPTTASVRRPRRAGAVVARAGQDSPLLDNLQFINPAFNKVDSEAEFMKLLGGIAASGKCPPELLPLWQDFFANYKKTILGSKQVGNNEKLVAQVQATILDVAVNQFVDPFTFPSMHDRLLTPYNYYEFGQRYVASLTDFDNSVLGHPERWAKMAAQLEAGENIILIANHQTEADPGVFAHMLETSHPRMATDVIYVAGDRVVTDALCKPFSMGRNLFCVHSKKHMDDEPELRASKMETNRRTLIAMQRRLNAGGALMWIAPSGGRDRPKEDGRWSPDPFDPAAVDLMASLARRAKSPTHLVPMAMFSYPIMPPPPKTEKAVGERRIVGWSGVGISACEPLDVGAVQSAVGEDKAEQQSVLAHVAWEMVTEEYFNLEAAINHPEKRGPFYTQPWRKTAVSA